MPGFLGTERQFAARYGKPILASRDARSSSREQEAGENQNLQGLGFFSPFQKVVNSKLRVLVFLGWVFLFFSVCSECFELFVFNNCLYGLIATGRGGMVLNK